MPAVYDGSTKISAIPVLSSTSCRGLPSSLEGSTFSRVPGLPKDEASGHTEARQDRTLLPFQRDGRN